MVLVAILVRLNILCEQFFSYQPSCDKPRIKTQIIKPELGLMLKQTKVNLIWPQNKGKKLAAPPLPQLPPPPPPPPHRGCGETWYLAASAKKDQTSIKSILNLTSAVFLLKFMNQKSIK